MAEYTVKEKMEHAIAEAAASFMTNEYVVKGAQLKCTLGSAPSLLNLPLCHGFYATGNPIIHSMDNKPMVNILPFGTCPVLGGPCVPAPVGPWLNTHDKTMIADAAPGGPLYPAVTMKSFLVCALGGLIEPKKSGQEYKAPGAATTLEGTGMSSAGSKSPANTGDFSSGNKESNSNTDNSGIAKIIEDQSVPLASGSYVPIDLDTLRIDFAQDSQFNKVFTNIKDPLLYEQNKTHWCYATSAYIMCKDKIDDATNIEIQEYAEDMKNSIGNEIDSYTGQLFQKDVEYNNATGKNNQANFTDWDISSKYIHTKYASMRFLPFSYTGLRDARAGSFSYNGNTFYFCHPIQSFIVDKVKSDPKSNDMGDICAAIDKAFHLQTELKGVLNSFDYWYTPANHDSQNNPIYIYDAAHLDCTKVEQEFLNKVKSNPVAVSVATKDSNGKLIQDSSHSIVVMSVTRSTLNQNLRDYTLGATLRVHDTLDGQTQEVVVTIKELFFEGYQSSAFNSDNNHSYLFQVVYLK